MAEDQDDSQKTEEPTQRKLDEARKKGQVATSQEVKHGFVLLGGLIVVAALAPVAISDMSSRMAGFLGRLETFPTDEHALIDLFGTTAGEIALIMLVPFAVFVAMAIAGIGFSVQHDGGCLSCGQPPGAPTRSASARRAPAGRESGKSRWRGRRGLRPLECPSAERRH